IENCFISFKAKAKKIVMFLFLIILFEELKKYISIEHPTTFLFTGNTKDAKGFDSRYSQRGVQWAIQSVCKKAGILKDVHTHSLRHSYATHLLEDGVNILQVQKLMGHERVETTM